MNSVQLSTGCEGVPKDHDAWNLEGMDVGAAAEYYSVWAIYVVNMTKFATEA